MPIRCCFRSIVLLCALSIALVGVPVAAQSPAATNQQAFLPLVFGKPLPPNPFGFDVRIYAQDKVLDYATLGFAQNTRPKWARVGDVLWADVEPVRGGGYHWDVLAQVEANIRRMRTAGIEPTLVVQQSPAWAQRVPGRRCSPMKPEYIGDFARFMAALTARYASGPLAVKYWEIWNEPDFAPSEVTDQGGYGCWVDSSLPYDGGAYYGQVLKQVYPAVKAANSDAVVIGGALAYMWPDETVGRTFLTGILAAGAGNSFDALSFHAYGQSGAGDLLITKATHIRQILSAYQLANKPLFATEISVLCGGSDPLSCSPNFTTWKQRQANFAARVYAEAIALNLMGAFWFTLAINPAAPVYNSQMIDDQNGTLLPRPAYYAFLNSALLLQGVRYTGPPITVPTPDQIDKVQVLAFQKEHSTLYVLWVPSIPDGFPKPYSLRVRPGAQAICTDRLDRPPDLPYDQGGRAVYYCSDTNGDGLIPRAVGELPMYVEVFP